MRCLVTGASGHVGAFLTKGLLARGCEVAVLVRPQSDLWRIADVLGRVTVLHGALGDLEGARVGLKAWAPETVFHLAWSGVTGAFRDDPAQITRNVTGSLELFEAAREVGCRCWVGVGSQAEYGAVDGVLREDLTPRPVTAYGVAKLCLGMMTEKLCAMTDTRFVWLRLLAAYGPMDDSQHMIPSLIESLLAGERPALTWGRQRWDYLYVTDAVEAICRLALETQARGVFNLGSGEAQTIRALAEKMRDRIDASLPLGFGAVAYPSDQIMHLQADVSKLQTATGWRPRVTLDDGLQLTIDWHRARQGISGNVRKGSQRTGEGEMGTRPEQASSAYSAHDERRIAVYQQTVRQEFAFLKGTTRLDDLYAKSIQLADDAGFLLPVCDLHATDDALIVALARWRAESAFAFPSQFEVTEAGTARWLRHNLLDVEGRLLFLVLDKHGAPIGHLGYANTLNEACDLEVDNVIRGVKGGHPGIMSLAMRALLDWGEEHLLPQSISLRVFSDNGRAIAFYRALGFVEDRRLPLRRHQQEGSILYTARAEGDTAPPDKEFLRMVYAPHRPVDGSEMILTAGPSISAREASYALDAARFGWNRQWSGYLRRFESAFADYIGVKHALATSSCTGALHLALLGLGVGPGDEVIVPDITWVATANAVVYTGATPVFADVQPGSWCLDPASFESLITPHTKAVIPVHLYGHPAEMDEIMRIAGRHGLRVVEDAAPSIGAEFRGRRVGTFGDLAAFSFQGAKLLVTGEGGMLVTDDSDLFERVQLIWDQGRDPHRTFWINQIGWKYKMSNIQAALGLGQIERADEQIEAKRRIFSWYAQELDGTPGLRLSREEPWARSICWMTSIEIHESTGLSRNALMSELKKRNVDTRPAFPAISQYPMWPRPQTPQPTALRIGRQAINLPSGVRLRHEQVEYVSRCVREILAEQGEG